MAIRMHQSDVDSSITLDVICKSPRSTPDLSTRTHTHTHTHTAFTPHAAIHPLAHTAHAVTPEQTNKDNLLAEMNDMKDICQVDNYTHV